MDKKKTIDFEFVPLNAKFIFPGITNVFKEEPSKRMKEFVKKIETIVSEEPGIVYPKYTAHASLDDIKEIIAFSGWGIEEIRAKSRFVEQSIGVYYAFHIDITKAFLEAADMTPSDAGLKLTGQGYQIE